MSRNKMSGLDLLVTQRSERSLVLTVLDDSAWSNDYIRAYSTTLSYSSCRVLHTHTKMSKKENHHFQQLNENISRCNILFCLEFKYLTVVISYEMHRIQDMFPYSHSHLTQLFNSNLALMIILSAIFISTM